MVTLVQREDGIRLMTVTDTLHSHQSLQPVTGPALVPQALLSAFRTVLTGGIS